MPAAPMLFSVLAGITDQVTSAIGDYGLYAVFALMLVDAVFPAASEVVMVYAGAVASGAFAGQNVVFAGQQIEEGAAAYLAMAAAGTIGYTIGSLAGWWIGVRGGRPFIEQRGRWLHLNEAKLDRAERWFERWGDWAVFFGRVTPVVRSFVSIPAGVFRAPLGRYTLLTLIGSAIWCFALAGAGLALGSQWEDFHEGFRVVDFLIVAALVGGAALLAWRLMRRRSDRASN